MAIKPIEVKMTAEALRKKRLKGFKLVGHGAFARVYAKNAKAKQVIKYGHESDEYIHFVKQVGILNPCLHVPTIFEVDRYFQVVKGKDWNGRPTKYNNNFYFVTMERLLRFRDISEKQRNVAFKRAGVEDIWSLMHPGQWKIVSPHTKTFKQIMQKTFKGHGHSIDLHDGNVMFRHRVHGRHDVYDLVVTDPLC